MRWRKIESQFGPFVIHLNSDDELHTDFLKPLSPEYRKKFSAKYHDSHLLPELTAALEAYFAGEINMDFNMVKTPAGPPFYNACWKACRRIPLGKTRSYQELAKMAGRPTALRAAGQAMRNNPIPIIVPCHRVLAATGKLHGFGGSSDINGKSLKLKQALLEHEQSALSL